jgi:dUTPase
MPVAAPKKKKVLQETSKVKRIPTEITADEPCFEPVYQLPTSVAADVFAKVTSNVPLPPGVSPRLMLAHRQATMIDCGFDIKIPPGYKAVISENRDLAAKGLLFDANQLTGETRVTFRARNIAKEIIPIPNKERIGTISIEPIVLMDFKVKKKI